ncbi:uncharacterized protein LOC134283308 [Saccostrea cucullata]|uniref:uncharacterized protein LOC134283308 n=1 Tax=Saccostrea cuccullata TaxID=36930 RepID=UPI002ED1E5BB
MAQEIVDLVKGENMNNNGEDFGFYNALPETQDPIGLELGLYNIPEPINKEDFGILTTTLDGIINILRAFREEVTNEFGAMGGKLAKLEVKISQFEDKMKSSTKPKDHEKPKGPKKSKETNPCFICKELGHWAPDCPRKERDLCFKCGQPGHWANECLYKDDDQEFLREVEKTEKKRSENTDSHNPQKKPHGTAVATIHENPGPSQTKENKPPTVAQVNKPKKRVQPPIQVSSVEPPKKKKSLKLQKKVKN